MNVAFVNRALGMRRGGGEIYDLEMAKALDSNEMDVTVYTGKPVTKDTSKPIDVKVKKVTSPFIYDLAYSAPIGIGGVISDIDRHLFITQVGRHLNGEHDIIHVNGYPEFLRLKEKVDCPMSIILNGPPHSLFYDYIHPTMSSYSWLKRADEVISTGVTAEKIRAEAGIHATTINPGVDAERFSPEGPEKQTTGPTILWVGRFVPAKNLTELVEAFANVRGEYPDAELWLVGEGGLKQNIIYLTEKLHVRNSVKFVGYVPNEELAPYYRTADVFALSSHHESFGMVLLEAMACETPVVAPRIDYIPNIVDEGETGLLYDQGNDNDLSNKIRAILDNPQQRELVCKRARKSVTQRFSWEYQAKKLRRCFESLI